MSRFNNLGIRGSILGLAAIVAGIGITRSCDGGGIVTSKHRVDLTFWNGFTGPDGRRMLEIIRDFNREHPDIQVSMQRMDWATYYNKLMVSAMDSRGPQLFVVHASTLPRMYRSGFIENSARLYSGAEPIPTADYDPYVLEQVKFKDQFAGVPLDIHPQGMYTNAEMLRAAGITRPPSDKASFMRALRVLTKKSGSGDPTQWAFALTLWRNNFQSLIPQFRGRYLKPNGDADLNNPSNIAALQFLGDLSREKLIPPPENGLGWVGYRQKKVAMVWDGVYMLGDLLRLQGLDYVAAPIPQIGPQPGTMADSHVLCIRRGLSEAQRTGAETFIRYLSKNSIRWAAAGQVPARRSVRETADFAGMPVQSAFARQIPFMMYPPRTPVLFEVTLEIDQAVEKVIRGNADAKTALDLANVNAQRAIDRDRAEQEFAPSGGQKP